MSAIAVIGIGRPNGNTRSTLDQLVADRVEVLKLCRLSVGPYAYEHTSTSDDFESVVETLLGAQLIILATPVYWYAMSTQLKALIDRLTELVTTKRRVGRELAGKTMLLAVTGSDPLLPEGFEVPFERTCAYLDMHWAGAIYVRVRPGDAEASVPAPMLDRFAATIEPFVRMSE
jgi:putative NADPH-quinone reductase